MIAIDQPQELTLTSEETRLVMAWRTMDDRGRVGTMGWAEHQATTYPRRTAPALRLVTTTRSKKV